MAERIFPKPNISRIFPLPADFRSFPGVYSSATPADAPTEFATLIEIDFNSGTRYYSFDGVGAPSQWYKDQVVAVSPIRREIMLLGGPYGSASCQIDLSNTDEEFSQLKASQPFFNRVVRIRFGDLNAGLGTLTTVFTGRITDWTIEKGILRLSVTDSTFNRFKMPTATTLLSTDTVSASFDDRLGNFCIPVLYGNVWSKCYQIGSTAEYVVAAHRVKAVDNVYVRIGTQWDALYSPSTYTVGTVVLDGVTCTSITFTSGIPTSGQVVSADVRGITDDGTPSGTLITNPVSQLEHFLKNYAGVSAAEIGATFGASTTKAAAYNGRAVITRYDELYEDVIFRFCQSFLGSFYVGLGGQFQYYIYAASDHSDTAGLPSLTDETDIIRDSFRVVANRDRCSNMAWSSLYNFVYDDGRFGSPNVLNDAAEQTNLGAKIRREFYAHYGPGDSTDITVATQALSFTKENTQFCEFQLPIQYFYLDLNDYVKLTHWQGIATTGGYSDAVMRILSLDIETQPRSMQIGARAVKVA